MRVCLVAVLVIGCGDNLQPANGADDLAHERYLPLVPGARWEYLLTPTNRIGPSRSVRDHAQTEVVSAAYLSDEEGWAFLIHQETIEGSKDVYEKYVGDRALRYREVFYDRSGVQTFMESFNPPRLKLDETPAHLELMQYSQSYSTTRAWQYQAPSPRHGVKTWTVISTDELITVPAGTFTTLHLRRSGRIRSQDYWYAQGVGKVKEMGGEQTEELETYSIPR